MRAAVFERAATDPAGGSLTFAAESPAGSAFVEFDGAGEVIGEGGDAAVVNEQIAPMLGTAVWQDAHVLTLALADGPATGDEQLEAGLYLAAAVAVPNPRASGVKTSMVGMALGCGKAAAVCTLAATWLPTIAGACYTDSVACAFAIGCAVASCLG
ncbi:hypothetical protein [Nannocystis pusilla]|uniref:hypothetical protein n=1 Tax=Nannocystis pusilla TaxID=889268 RepID=UPI003BEF625A